jgi:hypothetical protein
MDGSLDPRRAAHAGACPRCQLEADLLRRFLGESAADETEAAAVARIEARLQPPARPSRRRFWETWRLPALVPALALAAVVGIAIRQQARLQPSVKLESLGAGGPVRGAAFRILAPEGELATLPAEFAWTPQPGAAWYRIEVTLPDGTALGSVRSEAAKPAAPAFVLTALRQGRAARWRVIAFSAAGKRISETDWIQIRLGVSNP